MKRRTFIKLLSGLPLIGALPALAKPVAKGLIADKPVEIVFDGKSDYLKADAFTLNEPHTVMMLRKEVDFNGVATWHDLSGNGNHLAQSNPYFSPTKIKELRKFDAVHTEKERAEIKKAMARGEPESYFKRFRGYKANAYF